MTSDRSRICAAVVLFSFNPILYRQLHLAPLTLLWAVNVCAVIALVIARAVRRGRQEVLTLPRGLRAAVPLAICFSANNVLFLAAIQKTTIATAMVTHYLAPFFVAALAPVMLAERLQRRAVVAMLVACAGVVVLLMGNFGSIEQSEFVGVVYGLGSAVFFALEIVQKKALARTTPGAVIAARYLLLSVLLLAPFVDYRALAAVSGAEAAVLVTAGVVTSALGITLFTGALRGVSAQYAATISYVEPAAAIVWALLLLREIPSVSEAIGVALVVAGVLTIVLHKSEGDRLAPKMR